MRKDMVNYSWVLLAQIALSLVWGEAARAAGETRVEEMSDWIIAVAPDAIPNERYAARKFQQFFAQATGIQMAIEELHHQQYDLGSHAPRRGLAGGMYPAPLPVRGAPGHGIHRHGARCGAGQP